MKVNIQELIRFCDDCSDARCHANAIKTLAFEELLMEIMLTYFRNRGDTAEKLPYTCSHRRRKGHRLDAWVKVLPPAEAPVYYQVEVKSWSSTSLGGKRLPVNAPDQELRHSMETKWSQYWDSTKRRFKDQSLNKVLECMEVPKELGPVTEEQVWPLACLWEPMHPTGEPVALFEHPTGPSQDFKKVFVFSVGGYLRGLGKEDFLDLELPYTTARLDWLDRIFQRGC